MKRIILTLTEEELECLSEIINIGFIYSLIQNEESQELIKDYIKESKKWEQKLKRLQDEANKLEKLSKKMDDFLKK
jgi:hypothetical protein